jgi:hypothetical protein
LADQSGTGFPAFSGLVFGERSKPPSVLVIVSKEDQRQRGQVITTEKSPDSGPIKILWTGGWDSTFQFLQLLLVQKKRVAPYYLIDELRPSTGHELLTMEKIRASIRKIDNEVGKLIQPTQFHFVSDVTKQPKITKAYEAIRKRSFIGNQYDWLARFCAQEGISDLQLCIHRDDKAHAVVMNMATRCSGTCQ